MAVTVLLTAVGNMFFSSFQQTFTRSTDRYFTQKLSVSRINYLPPFYVVLKKVSFTEGEGPGEDASWSKSLGYSSDSP